MTFRRPSTPPWKNRPACVFAASILCAAIATPGAWAADHFADRELLTGATFSVTGDSTAATAEAGEPQHGSGIAAQRSLWWQWTAPSDGPVRVETTGSDFDTVLTIYRGNTLTGLSVVAENDDQGLQPTSCVTFEAEAGAQYQITVDTYTGVGGRVVLSGVQRAPGVIYSSDFATLAAGTGTLLGVQGWQGMFADSVSGILVEDGLHRAYLSSALPSGNVAALWLPVEYQPAPGAEGVIHLSTDWRMQHSGMAGACSYLLLVYDEAGGFLAGLDFDLGTGQVYRLDGGDRLATGVAFTLDADRQLDIWVDPVANTWTAWLGATPLFAGATFTSVTGAEPGLGSLSVAWTCDTAPSTASGHVSFSDVIIQREDNIPVGGPPAAQHMPYQGVRQAIPGRLEAEYFDEGGAEVAYHDTTSENLGGALRAEGVDLLTITGGYNIGWFEAGEWMLYSIQVEKTAVYRCTLRVASQGSGGVLRVDLDGTELSGLVAIPDTGSWTTWELISFQATLPAGTHDLRLIGIQAGPGNGGHIGDVDYLEFTEVTSTQPPIDLPSDPPPSDSPDDPPADSPDDPPVQSPDDPPAQSPEDPSSDEDPAPAPLGQMTPPQPQALSDRIRLTWLAYAGASEYEIWRSATSDFSSAEYVGSTSALSFDDLQLTAGTDYNYWVLSIANGDVIAVGTANAGLPPLSRLVNLSTRGRVQPDDPMIAGFVLNGAAPRRVLVRAVGPTLADFQVAGAVQSPTMSITVPGSGKSIVDIRNGWDATGDTSVLTEAVLQSGAFPLRAGSRDVATVLELAPGAYTAVVSDATGSGGVSLVEVYALDEATDPAGQLINISTRGYAGDGESALIAGVVVTGEQPKRLLIRGIGPALGSFNVPNHVADPMIEIRSSADDRIVAQNDNWSETAEAAATLAAAAEQTGAFSLTTGSADAGVVVELSPGAYTVQLRPARGNAGTGLVEVYEIR